MNDIEDLDTQVRLEKIVEYHEKYHEKFESYYTDKIVYQKANSICLDIDDRHRKTIELAFWYENLGHCDFICGLPTLYDWMSFIKELKNNLYSCNLLHTYQVYLYTDNIRFFQYPCFNGAMIEELDYLDLLPLDKVKVSYLQDIEDDEHDIYWKELRKLYSEVEEDDGSEIFRIMNRLHHKYNISNFNEIPEEERKHFYIKKDWKNKRYLLPCNKDGEINIDKQIYDRIGSAFFKKHKIYLSHSKTEIISNLIKVLTFSNIDYLTKSLLDDLSEYLLETLGEDNYLLALKLIKREIQNNPNSNAYLLLNIVIHVSRRMSYSKFHEAWNTNFVIEEEKVIRDTQSILELDSQQYSSKTSSKNQKKTKSRQSQDFEL